MSVFEQLAELLVSFFPFPSFIFFFFPFLETLKR